MRKGGNMIIFKIDGKDITNENIKAIMKDEPATEYDKWLSNQVKRETLVLVNKLKRIVNRNGCSSLNRLSYLKENIDKHYKEIEELLGINKETIDFMIEFVETNTRII